MSIDPDVDRYFKSYDRKTFHVVACGDNAPSERDVAAFETTIGFRLPDEFRVFTMSPLGGLYMEVHEKLWPPTKRYQVGPFWTFLRAIKVFGIAADIPEWLDLRVQHARLADGTGTSGLVPFLAVEGDPNRFCFDRTARIIEWSHEEPDKRTPAEEQSFSKLLLQQVRELTERHDRRLKEA